VTAQAVFSPLDTQLELSEGAWSEGLKREAVWLSGIAPSYELAEEVLERIGQLSISCSSIWRCAQEVGEQFQRVEQAERKKALALPERWEPPSRAQVNDQRMGVALDGALVHIREEGWKEVKIGTVFEVALTPSQDPITQEPVESAHAVHNSYVAHLGGAEVVGQMSWTEARRRGWEQAQDTQVIGDGALWIWNLAALHFPKSRQLVDWYHAKQHLVDAARALKPEGTAAFSRWLNSRTTQLYQGHAARIADELDQAAATQGTHDLAREATYFRHNHLRMNYLEMREELWPIGSGMVESGAKQFKARFCGPGMRWSRTGANNLLPIRAAVLSRRFNHLWTEAKSLPPH
jgi:hypothetical protein